MLLSDLQQRGLGKDWLGDDGLRAFMGLVFREFQACFASHSLEPRALDEDARVLGFRRGVSLSDTPVYTQHTWNLLRSPLQVVQTIHSRLQRHDEGLQDEGLRKPGQTT